MPQMSALMPEKQSGQTQEQIQQKLLLIEEPALLLLLTEALAILMDLGWGMDPQMESKILLQEELLALPMVQLMHPGRQVILLLDQ